MVFASIISCKEKVIEPVKEVKKKVKNDSTIVAEKDSLTPPVEHRKTDREIMQEVLKNSK